MQRQLFTTLVTTAALLAGTAASAQNHAASHAAMMSRHDSTAMAGMQVVHQLLASHERIVRTVENLPDGIRAVTESDDPAIAELLKQHVRSMEARLRAGTDAGFPMQSAAVRSIFRDRAGVRSTVEHTTKGVIVVQTSDNPATVAALQQHAAEVTELVRGGMAAMHDAMMKGDGMMHGMMHGGGMQRGGMMHAEHGAGTPDRTPTAPSAAAAHQSHDAHAAHAAHDDTAFAALQMRGLEAMGVDQYTSSHRFDALPDGGRIELQRDVEDPAGVARIREHLQAIAEAFRSGDFSTPAFVHLQQVPGADVMAARRHAISYTFRELPRGGELRITTQEPAALEAIHAFLAFQRHDHRTEKLPPSGRR